VPKESSNQESNKDNDKPVAMSAPSGGIFRIGFEDLNQDFKVPEDTFRKIKKLGKGAYGKVMQVVHIPTKKSYAVKRYEEIFSNDLRGKRLLRELSILKSVKHPCLNKLQCVLKPEDPETFNELYLVLDICDMDLKKLLKSSKYLEEAQVKSIVYDMLCGLNYLHKSNIIHRDLKPANILINDDCTIQICDFGLARSVKGLKKCADGGLSDLATASSIGGVEDTPKDSCGSGSVASASGSTNSEGIRLPSFEKKSETQVIP
jgi:serine/threonine protein kinase